MGLGGAAAGGGGGAGGAGAGGAAGAVQAVVTERAAGVTAKGVVAPTRALAAARSRRVRWNRPRLRNQSRKRQSSLFRQSKGFCE